MLAQTDMRSLYYQQSGMDNLGPMSQSTLQNQSFSYCFGSEKEREIQTLSGCVYTGHGVSSVLGSIPNSIAPATC